MANNTVGKSLSSTLLRQLTYLELSVLPELVYSYLCSMPPEQLKNVYLMHLQTFFEFNIDLLRATHDSLLQFETNLSLTLQGKVVGKCLIGILKQIVEFVFCRNLNLERLLFPFEQELEVSFAFLHKLLLLDLSKECQGADKYYLLAQANIVDLQWKLHQFRKKTIKPSLDERGETQLLEKGERILWEATQAAEQLFDLSVSASDKVISTRLAQFTSAANQLTSKYKYVLSEDSIIPAPALPTNTVGVLVHNNLPDELLESMPERIWEINSLYHYCATPQQKLGIVRRMLSNCIRNFEQCPIAQMDRLHNTTIYLHNELGSEHGIATAELTHLKSNIYCSILVISTLKTIKHSFSIAQVEETSRHLQQILEYHPCRIQSVCQLVLAVLLCRSQSVRPALLEFVTRVQNYYSLVHLEKEDLSLLQSIGLLRQLFSAWIAFEKEDWEKSKVLTKQLVVMLLNATEFKIERDIQIVSCLNIDLLKFVGLMLVAHRFYVPVSIVAYTRPVFDVYPMLVPEANTMISEEFIIWTGTKAFRLHELEEPVVNEQHSEAGRLMMRKILERVYNSADNHPLIAFMLHWPLTSSLEHRKMIRVKECRIYALKLLEMRANELLLEGVALVPVKKLINQNENLHSKSLQTFVDALITVLSFLSLLKRFIDNDDEATIECMMWSNFSWRLMLQQNIVSFCEKQGFFLSCSLDWDSIFEKHLSRARSFGLLEVVYEKILLPQITNLNGEQRRRSELPYHRHCQKWCQQEQNYQWFSDNKSNRLRVLAIRNYARRLLGS